MNGAPQSSANRKLWSELSKDLKSIDQAQYGRYGTLQIFRDLLTLGVRRLQTTARQGNLRAG